MVRSKFVAEDTAFTCLLTVIASGCNVQTELGTTRQCHSGCYAYIGCILALKEQNVVVGLKMVDVMGVKSSYMYMFVQVVL